MKTNRNILIIGAGPTGLTSALQFAKYGITPVIAEKRSSSSTLSRAVGIMPDSLQKLGGNVSRKILQESMPFMRINMHIDNNKVLKLDLNGKIKETEVLTGLPQDRTEEIMKEELAALGIDVSYNTEVTNIRTNEDFAEVWFDNKKEKVKFDWVIACDGVNSRTRTILNIDFNGYDLNDEWSIADIELNGRAFDYAANNVWMKIGRNYDAVVSLPIGLNRVRLISTTEDCLKTIPIDLDINKIHRKGNFKVSIRQISTYKNGRVLFAGDSAHCHSPVGGKGMNLGINDAVAAVNSIIQEKTELYSKERHKIGAKVLKDSESLRKMIMSKNPLLKIILKSVFSTINNVGFMQKVAIKRISQL